MFQKLAGFFFLAILFSCTQPNEALRLGVEMAWNLDTDLPHGLQDNTGGFIGNNLVMTGGYCSAYNDPDKPGKYTGGFIAQTQIMDLTAHKWVQGPDFPGGGRQGLFSAVVGSSLYVWGGLNYTAPYCYSSGWKLTQIAGIWTWIALPNLPQALAFSGVAVVGTKVYVMGGSLYTGAAFQTDSTVSKFYVIDTADLAAGWTTLAFPGTPRATMNMSSSGTRIFVLGGAYLKGGTVDTFYTVVDNWSYDTVAQTWTRLKDLPACTGVWSSQASMWRGRYVFLTGGYEYARLMTPGLTTAPSYGFAHRDPDFVFYDTKSPPYLNNDEVYDTQTNTFLPATSLPFNTSGSMLYVHGNDVWLIGGEIDQGVILGEWFWHHPDLFLHGTPKLVSDFQDTGKYY